MLKFSYIDHIARNKLGISVLEYCIVDQIQRLSSNPSNPKLGWCFKSRNTMAEDLGITKRSVVRIIDRMVEKGFIVKNEEGHTRHTQLWYDSVVIESGDKKSPPRGQKVTGVGDKKSPYSNSYNNKDKEREEAPTFEANKNTLPLKSVNSFSPLLSAGGGGADSPYQLLLNAFNVRNSSTLESAAMRVDGQEWQYIAAHLPEYLNRTHPQGLEGKPFRATAIGYLKTQKWINDPNPEPINTKQIPRTKTVKQIPRS